MRRHDRGSLIWRENEAGVAIGRRAQRPRPAGALQSAILAEHTRRGACRLGAGQGEIRRGKVGGALLGLCLAEQRNCEIGSIALKLGLEPARSGLEPIVRGEIKRSSRHAKRGLVSSAATQRNNKLFSVCP